MNSLTKRMLAVAGLLALGLTFARAQSDGALLDALVKKGVLSDQEAEDIRADEAKEFATTPAGKLAVADYIKQITFYGDGRLRFDGLSQQNHYEANNINDRERYRLRFGVDYAYSNHLKAGAKRVVISAPTKTPETVPTLVMGVSDLVNYKYSYLRVLLGPGQIDYPAYMDLQISGVSDDALAEKLRRCDIRYLLLPNAGAAFSMTNYYTAQPLFSYAVRSLFDAHYTRSAQHDHCSCA